MENPNNNNLWYNKRLCHFARENRNDMTKAEACIWKYLLSRRKMRGYSFRRQRPVLSYIADFMCKELLLIIEVDVLTHQWDEVFENDRIREKALRTLGFTILRFDDNDVLTDINGVCYQIEKFIEEFERIHHLHSLP